MVLAHQSVRTIILIMWRTCDESTILGRLGERIAAERAAARLTLSDLARRSGLSRRYLTEAEAGRANLSVLELARVAAAPRVPLERLVAVPLPAPVNRRIALVGLRGAGKSTVGPALALALEVPFVELDELVAERAGLALAEIFAIHGEGHYRTLEREALEQWLASAGAGVLATGGSIVTHEESWRRLLDTCHVVWLRADPEDHWRRVLGQGDTRPMRARDRAMDELRAILEAYGLDSDLSNEPSPFTL